MTIESTLKKWNADLVKDDGVADAVAPELLEAEWLGLPRASESEIASAEERLGVLLPLTYREFLGSAYFGPS